MTHKPPRLTPKMWAILKRIAGGDAVYARGEGCYRSEMGRVLLDGRVLMPLIKHGLAEWIPGHYPPTVRLTVLGLFALDSIRP